MPEKRRLNPLVTIILYYAMSAIVIVATGIVSIFLAGRETTFPWHHIVLNCFVVLFSIAYWFVPAFMETSRRLRLARIFLIYICLIISFASTFFAMSFIGDLADSNDAYAYYSKQQSLPEPSRRPRTYDLRAFRGIDGRLWTTAEVGLADAKDGSTAGAVNESIEASRRPLVEVTQKDKGKIVDVFLDCLHLSVITMTTVGYGDMSPKSRWAKLATDAEALGGVTLLVVAFGIAMAIPPDHLK